MPDAAFEFSVATQKRQDLVNITRHLEDSVRRSGVDSGIACVQVPHTTCALILNEDESGLRQDILRMVSEVVEPLRPKDGFAHDRIDDNASRISPRFCSSLRFPSWFPAGGRRWAPGRRCFWWSWMGPGHAAF